MVVLRIKQIFRVGLTFIFLSSVIADIQESDYHGDINEDAVPGTNVQLDKQILVTNTDGLLNTLTGVSEADSARICGYTLYKTFNDALPFRIVLLNETTGDAKIQLETNAHLDYAKQHTYNFQIAARECLTGNHAYRKSVHIEVLTKATPAPAGDDSPTSTWEQESYTLEVEENKLYDDILQLEIEGLKGSAVRKCQFYIKTPDVPFIIDNQETMGILRNVEKLSYARQHNYILEVMARDCGSSEKNSKPLLIDIIVKRACAAGWQGVDDVMTYESGKLIKPVAAEASLTLCDDTCSVQRVRVSVTLNTRAASSSCDRDTHSVQTQRQLCGASEEIVDLLSTSGLEDGDDSFEFDGVTDSIEVPDVKFNHTLQSQFTIMTWMKHTPSQEELVSHKKEHILCNADNKVKNRHHYALYVHNCKLVLLLRQEYHDGVDLKEFKPAEWRWSLPEVCDGDWHHYALSMDFPNALLHIDGTPVKDHDAPEVIDDWALHSVSGAHGTKLHVGACWMGGEKHMTQHFQGELAGLSMLNGVAESDRVIKCVTNCAEKLDFHAMNEMQTGMTVAFNSAMSEITIEGGSLASVEKLLQKVGYENSRIVPTPGDRSIEIKTQVNCSDKRQLQLDDVTTTIVIAAPPSATPSLRISGVKSLSPNERQFSPGVAIFNGIEITDKSKKPLKSVADRYDENDVMSSKSFKSQDIPEPSAADSLTLDSCIVKVEPSMDFDDYSKEHIKYPENLVDQLSLEVYQKEESLLISGPALVEHYVQVLRQLRYYNSHAEALNHMTFTLTCSALNKQSVSNQFQVELNVVHVTHLPLSNKEAPRQPQQQRPLAPPAAHAKDNTMNEPIKSYGAQRNHNSLDGVKYASHVTSGSGLGMVVIVVVCLGFLLLMIVLGVVRIHSTHTRNTHTAGNMDEKAEMEWDNSALTITVNPMDQEGAYDEEDLAGVHGAEDSDSDDDMSNFHGDHDDDSTDEEPDLRELKSRGLEWDESDLSKYQCKV